MPNCEPSTRPSPSRSAPKEPVPPPRTMTTPAAEAIVGMRETATIVETKTISFFMPQPPPLAESRVPVGGGRLVAAAPNSRCLSEDVEDRHTSCLEEVEAEGWDG